MYMTGRLSSYFEVFLGQIDILGRVNFLLSLRLIIDWKQVKVNLHPQSKTSEAKSHRARAFLDYHWLVSNTTPLLVHHPSLPKQFFYVEG